MSSQRSSFWISLFVGFIDHLGVGLVYPLFASMLFDRNFALLPPDTSLEVRGMWLGVLIALMPLIEFFAAPFWGALSDGKGRKKPLQMSVSFALAGYIVALVATYFANIYLLLASRVVIGFAAGNISIVQAAVADLSTPDEKSKNFGLYGMALGTGFAFGPFFGGFFSRWGYSIPFLAAIALVIFNLGVVYYFFRETNFLLLKKKVSWHVGLLNFKKAFKFKGLRIILLASFLHCFAWSYFFEFISVYLIANFDFSSEDLGLFYGIAGASYALSTGYLIRPFTAKFKPASLLFAGNLLAGLSILLFPFVTTTLVLWIAIIVICYFVAFVWPSATAIVSNHASGDIQGESLGIFAAVNAMGFVLSPLLSGSWVGTYPTITMWVSGIILVITSLILFRSLKAIA
ncbi:MAG: MFS transporter [Chlamydiales bacterium]|nr:MFS transporter [Chlamydiales bacterium]